MGNKEKSIISIDKSENIRKSAGQIKEVDEGYRKETGRQKLVFTQTFGCPMV